jgi:hypothetical protein
MKSVIGSRGASVLAVWLGVAWLCGCSSGEASVGVSIGPEGGSVTADGASVQIPAGALASPTEVTLEIVGSGYPAIPSGLTLRGDVVAFQPHGTAFALPVVLEVPFADGAEADNLKLFSADPGGSWSEVPDAVVVGSVLRVEVLHFSYYAPGEGEPLTNCGGCTAPAKDDGSYLCVQIFYESEFAAAMRAGHQSNCADGGGAFADACPANANPGCCMTGGGDMLQATCYYNCNSDFCSGLHESCTESGGRWGTP